MARGFSVLFWTGEHCRSLLWDPEGPRRISALGSSNLSLWRGSGPSEIPPTARKGTANTWDVRTLGRWSLTHRQPSLREYLRASLVTPQAPRCSRTRGELRGDSTGFCCVGQMANRCLLPKKKKGLGFPCRTGWALLP